MCVRVCVCMCMCVRVCVCMCLCENAYLFMQLECAIGDCSAQKVHATYLLSVMRKGTKGCLCVRAGCAITTHSRMCNYDTQ